MEDLDALTDDELLGQLTTWAGRIAAGEARLLALVAELDRREAWAGPGMLSCAHWLAWRLGLGLVAARERVRVARGLRGLPLIATALAAGQLSFSQVRAITRVAAPDDQQTWLDAARHATGAQLERLARGVRRAQRALEDEDDPAAAAFRYRTRTRYDQDGVLHLNMRASAADGAVVVAALERSRSLLQRERAAAAARAVSTDGAAGPDSLPERPVSLTDALLHLARAALDGGLVGRPGLRRRDRRLLRAQVDPLSGWGRLPDGELLPQAACHGSARPGCAPLAQTRLPAMTGAAPGQTRPWRSASSWPGSTGSGAACRAAPTTAACRPTTSASGPGAAARIWPTWSCSAPGTKPSSTTAATAWPWTTTGS